jgi:DNA (cytosine-5)-methyltransferase 1
LAIPIIDIFAGPGGLGEGFSAFCNEKGERPFKIGLSIEKDPWAHQTLTLRSFFRQFSSKESVPEEYYQFLRGEITLKTLYDSYPVEAELAKEEAWLATLGEIPAKEVDDRIRKTLNQESNWILIGGPPCQAYSLVGRSRNQRTILDERQDHRVGLYKQYLRILAVHNPAVFIMENVKGLLSASTKDNQIFSKIRKDLSDPVTAYYEEFGNQGIQLECPGYKIYSLVSEPIGFDGNNLPVYAPKDFLVETEKYGVPQTRHRIILMGIRNGIEHIPGVLEKKEMVPVKDVLDGLPRLRGGLSKISDTPVNWKETIRKILDRGVLAGTDKKTKELILETVENLKVPVSGVGQDFLSKVNLKITYKSEWFLDNRIKGICNHTSKGHMESDFLRYLFVSSYGTVHGISPKLEHFPKALLPKHKNVDEGIESKKFADRFRVQVADQPAKTITSHISKDGHYYIHPDPSQCRSLTVREAARIQTFPDNYFFCGSRTEQYHQVGNAVPPYLANQIAEVVIDIFQRILHA